MAVTALIVDDSDPFRILLRTRLERIGCKVVGEAKDSKDALQLFRRLKPQVVTLDLIMPDAPEFGSKELFEKIREESPRTAVIILSVKSRHANASRFLARGAVAYLEKSFVNFDEIQTKLKHLFPELGRPAGSWERLRPRR